MEEFDDLVDGVDLLIEQGMVDADRVGITGGSYGGYATAWGATQYSGRFAAAVMNVGLSNQIAAFGTSDIPQDNPPPVRLVLYPAEGHGNRRAASSYGYSLRLMRWINHYLKGEGGDPPPYRIDYGFEEGSDID